MRARRRILHVETLLRENDLSLLGFATQEERQLYRLLVKVDGIGPKLALAAWGPCPWANCCRPCAAGREGPGAHPRRGQEDRRKAVFRTVREAGRAGGPGGAGGRRSRAGTPGQTDLRSALTNLGFREDAVLPVIQDFKEERPPLAEAIRRSLKALQH